MPDVRDVYKCATCATVVEVLGSGQGQLSCCGAPMAQLREGTTDGAREKHVPVVEKTATGYRVAVGSQPHPMIDAHYIQWIELLADGVSYFRFLKPGDAPEAEFCCSASDVSAREYCNLHGLWKS